MLHLIRYNILVKFRNFNTIFWPLAFPLILGTLFYFAFGKLDEADFETVETAVVEEAEADAMFLEFLDTMADGEEQLLAVEKMSKEEALTALTDKKVSGIFFVGKEPSLTVGGNGIAESILQSLLESYGNGKQTMEHVMKTHPEGMPKAVEAMADYKTLVEQASLGGRTTDGNVQFFYALVAMACLYGAFMGFGAAIALQANLTPVAARRCITPTHKLKLVVSEMLSCFVLHFVDILVLLIYLRYILKLDFRGNTGEMLLISLIGSMIGVSMGIFVGSIGRMQESVKVGILLGMSMVGSFLAGLMNAEMKYMVDHYAPIVNKLNPAALISDAFYCINVYDDRVRYTRSLATLSVMCAVLVIAAFYMVRRERYDSL
ncbi:MAG: ABC transporter permease [Coprococcus sp.]|nr:ABC transporter permease [Coprococcus sp.]